MLAPSPTTTAKPSEPFQDNNPLPLPPAPSPIAQGTTGADLNIAKYISGTDPRVAGLIIYLMSLGAPSPKILDQVITVPGGLSYPLDELAFDDGKGHSKMIDASLGYAFPNVAANNLADAGIITLKTPLFNVPVPMVNGIPGVANPTKDKPPKASSPIGPAIPNTGHFEVEPYWVFSLGTPWTDLQTGKTYILDGAINPFGQEQWWKPVVAVAA